MLIIVLVYGIVQLGLPPPLQLKFGAACKYFPSTTIELKLTSQSIVISSLFFPNSTPLHFKSRFVCFGYLYCLRVQSVSI